LAPCFGDATPDSSLSFSGGDAFSVTGVPIAKDAAVFDAGFDFAIRPNAMFGVSYGGQFDSDVSDQSVRANFILKF
jgi:outer membrane autotransporter protein